MGILRLLLACSVVFEHCPSWIGLKLIPGHMAVELFFMISGFYMSLVLTEKYNVRSGAGIRSFYLSRFFRLWPLYLVTMVGTTLWWLFSWWYLQRPPTAAADFSAIMGPVLYPLMQFSNWFMVGHDIPNLFHGSVESGLVLTMGYTPEPLADGSAWLGSASDIGQAWSIGTELWFYLCVPFLIKLSTRNLVILMAAGLLVRAGMEQAGWAAYFFFPAQLPLFLGGVLAQRHGSRSLAAPHSAFFNWSCVMLVGAGSLAYGSVGEWAQSWKWVLYVPVVFTLAALFEVSKRLRLDRLIGEWSYPVYIIHVLAYAMLRQIGN
ncbi:MAG: acyltransferase, partial [Pseudomonadota bacterium]